MLSPFLVSPLKIHYPLSLPPPPQPTHSSSWPWHIPILGHRTFKGPRASPPIDDRLGNPLLQMQLEPWIPPCVFFDWWFSPRELWCYWLVHIVVPPRGLKTPSASWVLSSSSFIGDPVLCPMHGCEHPLLYLSGTSRDSQEAAILGSRQQNLFGIQLFMGWIPRWGVSEWSFDQSMLPVKPSMGTLFPFKEGLKNPHFALPSSWVSCVLKIVSWVF